MRDDPISAASARLLAAGVPRADRLQALRILAALVDHADPRGHVQPDPDALAADLGLDAELVTYRLIELDRVGAIRPHADRWAIRHFEAVDPTLPSFLDGLEEIARIMGDAEVGPSPVAGSPVPSVADWRPAAPAEWTLAQPDGPARRLPAAARRLTLAAAAVAAVVMTAALQTNVEEPATTVAAPAPVESPAEAVFEARATTPPASEPAPALPAPTPGIVAPAPTAARVAEAAASEARPVPRATDQVTAASACGTGVVALDRIEIIGDPEGFDPIVLRGLLANSGEIDAEITGVELRVADEPDTAVIVAIGEALPADSVAPFELTLEPESRAFRLIARAGDRLLIQPAIDWRPPPGCQPAGG